MRLLQLLYHLWCLRLVRWHAQIRLYVGRLCFRLSICLAMLGKKISGI